MPEPTRDERVARVRAAAIKALGSHPALLARFHAANFDRMSPADLTDMESRLGGRVT